jgi:hypothetical protein
MHTKEGEKGKIKKREKIKGKKTSIMFLLLTDGSVTKYIRKQILAFI